MCSRSRAGVGGPCSGFLGGSLAGLLRRGFRLQDGSHQRVPNVPVRLVLRAVQEPQSAPGRVQEIRRGRA